MAKPSGGRFYYGETGESAVPPGIFAYFIDFFWDCKNPALRYSGSMHSYPRYFVLKLVNFLGFTIDKNITIICQNSDKFKMSQIRIEKSLIQDSEGNNIFQIKSYSSPEQFSCDISLNSVKITTQGNNATEPETQVETEREQDPEPEPEQTKKGYSSRFWRTNSGLSGGTIVAIIIPLVVVIIALIIVFGGIFIYTDTRFWERTVNQ